MKYWPGWLPLLLGGMVACASTTATIPNISLPDALDTPAPTSTPPVIEATPTPAPVTDKIAFASSRSANEKPDIYLMNSDGSGLARLTDDPAGDTSPAWSPDRGQIAFVSDRSGVNQLYVMEPDGSNQEVLTDQPAGASAPARSPDGRRIAFVSNRALGSEGQRSRQPSPSYALYVFDLETQEAKLIAGGGGGEIHYPNWKPR